MQPMRSPLNKLPVRKACSNIKMPHLLHGWLSEAETSLGESVGLGSAQPT